jgi:hypothetical protein
VAETDEEGLGGEEGESGERDEEQSVAEVWDSGGDSGAGGNGWGWGFDNDGLAAGGERGAVYGRSLRLGVGAGESVG